MYHFEPSDEQQAIIDMTRAFAEERMAPHAVEWDQSRTLPLDVLREAAGLGLAGVTAGEAHGGGGLGPLDSALIFEQLSQGCPVVAAFLSIHNMCTAMIDSFGSDAMRAKWIPKLCSMETVASYCLTEPGSGSDAAALRASARREGDDIVLNGVKTFISGAGLSDLYVVMARTGGEGPGGVSTVLVENGTPGLSFGANETKMGWAAQPTAEVRFDDCRIPASNLLGQEGDGFKYAMRGLDSGRLNIAACSLGGAQAALDKATRYMGERQAFGKRLDEFQALQFRLADMETELQAARVFLRQAAWRLQTGALDATKHCAMAKRFVTDVGFRVANDALQLFGGYGYLSSFGVEKIVRDLRVHQILEGTNEIMRLIIARALLQERNQ